MVNPDDYKAGEMTANIVSIKETLSRMEESINRFGQRTGDLEEKQREDRTEIAILRTAGIAAIKDIEDLKGSRKWFLMAIVGGFLTALWKVVSGGK